MIRETINKNFIQNRINHINHINHVWDDFTIHNAELPVPMNDALLNDFTIHNAELPFSMDEALLISTTIEMLNARVPGQSFVLSHKCCSGAGYVFKF